MASTVYEREMRDRVHLQLTVTRSALIQSIVKWRPTYQFISSSSVYGGSEQKREQRNGPSELHFLFKISDGLKEVNKCKIDSTTSLKERLFYILQMTVHLEESESEVNSENFGNENQYIDKLSF